MAKSLLIKDMINYKSSIVAIIILDVIFSVQIFAPWDEFQDIPAMLGLCLIVFWINAIFGSFALSVSKTRKLGWCLLANSIIAPIAIFEQTVICNDRNYYNTYGPTIEYTFTQGDWGYMLTFYERDLIFKFDEGDFRDSRNTHWHPNEGKYSISSDNAFHFCVKGKEYIVRNDTLINFKSYPIPLSKDNALVKFMNR